MKQFVFKQQIIIPQNRIEDVRKIRNFIVTKMNIQITLMDTYLLWESISADHCAGWLLVDLDEWRYMDPPENFFMAYMEKFGRIQE